MKLPVVVFAVGVLLLVAGHAWGLALAPPEATMGQTGRLLFVHVPTAWTAMAAYTAAVAAAAAGLWTGARRFVALAGACVETGVVLNALMLLQGALWARPTWGVWLTPTDPRFLLSLAAFVGFGRVLLLYRLLPEARRLVWAGVATVLVFPTVPLLYASARLWRTIHPMPTESLAPPLVPPLLLGGVGMLAWALGLQLAWARSRKAAASPAS